MNTEDDFINFSEVEPIGCTSLLKCNYPLEIYLKMSIMFVVGKQIPLNKNEVLIYETFQPNILGRYFEIRE